MEEVWKDINNYEGLYQISSYGKVRSLDRGNRKGRVLKLNPTKGYLGVFLSKYGNSNKFQVHRLVCQMFLENPENKCCVNHKDGDKSNNNVLNLEWVTHSENIKHAFDNGLNKYTPELKEIRAKARRGKKLNKETVNKIIESNSKPILCIEDNLIFNNLKEVSEYYNISKTTFHRKFHKGEKIKDKTFKYNE